MNKIFCFSTFVCLGLLFQPDLLSAQAITLNPAQQKYLLEKAAELEAVAFQHMQRNHSSVLQTLQRAAGDPDEALELYLDAIENLDFKQEGKKESEFREWRDRRQDQFRDANFARSIQLQAQYILLTLEAMESTTDQDLNTLVSRVLVFTGRVNPLKPLDRRDVLNTPLNRSYIVRQLNLNLAVNLNPPWVMTPGDTQEIYSRFIFPSIIKLNNADMLKESWEIYLIQEQTIAEKTNAMNEFNALTLAELHWERAKDFHSLGDLDNGLLRMLTILQSNTKHPKALEWNREFQGLVQKTNPQQ